MTEVWLTIGDKDFGGWVRLRVERSVDSACSQFGVVATRNWPGNAREWDIQPGDAVQLRVDDALLVTGWIDTMSPGYDKGYHTIELSGRGKVCDLVDCSWIGPPSELKQATADQIITTLAAQHDIAVTFDADPGEPLDFAVQTGETVWEAIERITRLRQLLAYDQPDGSLMVSRVSEEYCETELTQGENILAATASIDDRDRFSMYLVKGQQSGGDEVSPKQAAEAFAQVEDPSIRRYRPLLLVQSAQTNDQTAEDRAHWEMQNRFGNGRSAEIKVQGLLQPNGRGPWPVNRLVRLNDDWLGCDREMAISKVAIELGASGSTTTLTLVPPEALVPNPAELEKKTTDGASGAGSGGGASFWEQVAADRQAGETRRLSSKE